ncbi:venom allergen 3-like [Polyergus mexicanus]|uniref:venom allergen 3-like n=1 Tax=Polyergus mexicanus TaxID=615972 RepID=UPI0038B48C71
MEILENEDMTCDIIRDILDTHNRLRQSIAEGSINAQPPAANMHELYWDSELASGAQNWANQCIFAHNDEKDRKIERFPVGQNIGLKKMRGSQNIAKIEFSKQINKWFSEHEDYQFSAIDTKIIKVVGHYTQLAWANTYLVGCGYSQYKTSNNTAYQFYVCHYGPTGNEFGKLPYIVGNRSCDYSLKISDKYPNLCSFKNVPVSCPKNNVEEIRSDKRSTSARNGRKFLNVHRNIHNDNSPMYQRKNQFVRAKCADLFLSWIFYYIIL